jgi:hypothetical protein
MYAFQPSAASLTSYARLLDLGERDGELLPNRMLAPGDGRARLVMRVASLLQRDSVWPFAPFAD